ncbi:MAG: LamG-like jellyroll fold domain-containing protein [Planctomycetota bacterium]
MRICPCVNMALSVAAVLGLLGAVPAVGAELVAHWRFDEDIQDVFGATTKAHAGAAITRSDARVGPGCLSLENSYLVVDPSPSLDTPEFTMTFWIYYDSSYQKRTLRQTGRADDRFETGYDGDQLLLYVKGQTPSWIALYRRVKMNEWAHYAYVYTGGKLTAYEDAGDERD